jgi:hypothetical protein
MEYWWHDFFSTMAQVTALLVVAAVVEQTLVESVRELDSGKWPLFSIIVVAMVWLCAVSTGFLLWTLSERTPEQWLIDFSAWFSGLASGGLAIVLAAGITRKLIKEARKRDEPASPPPANPTARTTSGGPPPPTDHQR